VLNYFVISGLLIFLGITLFIDVFQYFLGAEFRSGLNIVPIVLIANLFYGVFFNLSVWYKLTDRTRNGAVIALIGATITLIANILLIPVMGYTGAAWAHLACYSTMMIISYFWGKKVYPIPYKINRFLFYLILALGLYFISVAVHPDELLIRLLFNAMLLAVFVTVAVLLEHKGFRATQRIS